MNFLGDFKWKYWKKSKKTGNYGYTNAVHLFSSSIIIETFLRIHWELFNLIINAGEFAIQLSGFIFRCGSRYDQQV